MKAIAIHIILCFTCHYYVGAQTLLDDSLKRITIPPLNQVIEAAYLHSPLLLSKDAEIERFAEEVKIEKKEWLNHIYIEGATSYGMYNQLVIRDQSDFEDNSSSYFSRNEQVRYFGGVGIKIPLSSAFIRRNAIKSMRLRQEQAAFEKLRFMQVIEQLIIEEYYNLKYLEESMNTCNKTNQTLEISYLKAEKDVLNGHMDLNEFAILTSTVGKTKNEYLKIKNLFFAQYNKLQSITGITFD